MPSARHSSFRKHSVVRPKGKRTQQKRVTFSENITETPFNKLETIQDMMKKDSTPVKKRQNKSRKKTIKKQTKTKNKTKNKTQKNRTQRKARKKLVESRRSKNNTNK